MCINNLADTANKYNNTDHSTTKIKSVDVKSSTYIDFGKTSNYKDLKFKVGEHTRTSKHIKVMFQIGLKFLLFKNHRQMKR